MVCDILLYSIFQKSSNILKKRVIWICFFTPPTLLHSVFIQNFQRPGLLWLRVNETGLKPLGEPMPKFFSGLDLVCFGFFLQGVELFFFAGGGVVTCRTHLLALFTA